MKIEIQQMRFQKFNPIGIVRIYQNEKIIEYQIDISKCLRLNDLIYMIVYILYIKFYLTYNLQESFQNNFQLYFLIQQENSQHYKDKYKIDHQYLDYNRIWLIFQDSIKDSMFIILKLSIQLHLLGYLMLII
ncbi:unnamed protein product [Paramecium sonneborni]|uniref:Transmembrane protein n=1 Tax=Paramecium sonneborni TaxID=65129 RepID=A0A8S1R133_9CILI|nr:unnamed protein product [Paramecium sonneborni]